MAKVLLVEDDNNLREIYEARLAAEGYEISSASDGEEALVVAKQAKPDLVISDVMMPKISGFEMLDILRNTQGLEHVKVIMLTALGQGEDRDRADSLGADKYLVKSQVTLEDIVKTAHELLGEGDAPIAVSDTTEASATPAPAEPVTPAAVEEPAQPMAAPPTEQPQPAAPVEETPAPAPAVTTPTTDSSVDPVATPPAQSQTTDDTTATDENQDIAGSIAQEEALVQDQIDNFVQNAPVEPPAEQEQAAATEAPADSVTTEEPALAEAPTTSDQPPTDVSPDTEVVSAPEQEPAAVEEPAAAPETPALAEPPVTPPVEPEEQAAPASPAEQQAEAEDDQIMANAVDELASESGTSDETTAEETPVPESSVAETPEAATPTVPEQPTEAEQLKEQNEKTNISISGKKVIQPLESEPKPDINELLAREEATNPDLAAGEAVVSNTNTEETAESVTTEPVEPPEIIHKPGQSFSPEPLSEAPAAPAAEDDRPSGAPAPSPSQQKEGFDPNSIAL